MFDVQCIVVACFFFQAEDGIRDLVRSRGLGDVYKRQGVGGSMLDELAREGARRMLAAALQAEVAAYIEQHLSLIHI